LSDALEVKARTTSVNEKITYAAEVRDFFQLIVHLYLTVCKHQVQSVLRQLLTEVYDFFFLVRVCMLIYRIVIKPSNGTNNYCMSLSNFYLLHYNLVVWNAGLNCGRSSHRKPYLTSGHFIRFMFID
jgi:hypothetical protein